MFNYLLIVFTLYFFITGCTRQIKPNTETGQSNYQLNDGKYDSNFPLAPVDERIALIEKSVKLITTLTFYQAYDFSLEDKITIDSLDKGNFTKHTKHHYVIEQPASGTGTLIAKTHERIALLTCAHIVSTPDTLINYFFDAKKKLSPYVQNLAIKSHETINVISMPFLQNIQVLVHDKDLDIAILHADLNHSTRTPLHIFNIKMGKAKELNWGTFVYVIGFPYGKKLISTAIVSDPNRDRYHNFMLDATMHRGISGGLILALRDGPPNFELVGLVSSISAEQEYILQPEPTYKDSDINFTRSYKGEIFLNKRMNINYGITYALSVEAIQDFLSANMELIREEGFEF